MGTCIFFQRNCAYKRKKEELLPSRDVAQETWNALDPELPLHPVGPTSLLLSPMPTPWERETNWGGGGEGGGEKHPKGCWD